MSNLPTTQQLEQLKVLITENLRIQESTDGNIPYIDAGGVLALVRAKQNHVVFGRRGCGKTLLLRTSRTDLKPTTKVVYLNCEEFKHHTFPNVLIEILDAVFLELETKRRSWFGGKKALAKTIADIRKDLEQYRLSPDEQVAAIKALEQHSTSMNRNAGINAKAAPLGAGASFAEVIGSNSEIEKQYTVVQSKIDDLHRFLPSAKRKLKEFFQASTVADNVYLQLDDFYHLRRTDQPQVVDYIHRLCKELPLWFKIATLRHSSVLYVERNGQPIGAQERHDYQPINVDFTLEDFKKTVQQNYTILEQFADASEISKKSLKAIFKGDGFTRLVLAGGGVPRDVLSIFLEMLGGTKDNRIGKDDVRFLSLSTLERRIEDLKKDSQSDEQDNLLRGIHAIREFCLGSKNNVFCIEESVIREDASMKTLIYKLLDYRIIHSVASGFTHKTKLGAYRAFAIDVGCYAYMRKLHGKMIEIDFAASDAKERIRSAPILSPDQLHKLLNSTPDNVEQELLISS
jgi:hypothetical protein